MSIVAAAIIAIVGGCGDDGSSGTTTGEKRLTRADTTVTTGSLSKAQFVSHSNNYCRNSWTLILHRLDLYRDEQGPKASEKEIFTEASQNLVLPAVQFQFDQMHQVLPAPAGDKEEVEDLVGTMQIAIESGQRQRISSPQELPALFADYNQLAYAYGVDDCVVREAFFGGLQPKDLEPSGR